MRIAPWAVALAIQAALTAAMLWPLPVAGAHVLLGGTNNWIVDTPLLMFTLASSSRALVTNPAQIFDAPMFYPSPHATLYGPTALGVLPIFAPVFLYSENPVLALNVAYAVCLCLSAWTAHLVVYRWSGLHGAGIVAGCVFLSAEWIAHGWVVAAPSYAALQWFPLLIARAMAPIASLGGWATLALLAWLQCMTDIIYVAPAVLLPLGAIGMVRVLRTKTRRDGVAVLAAAGAATLGLVPLLAAHYAIRLQNPRLQQQTTWRIRLWPNYPGELFSGPTALMPAAWVLLAVGVVLLIRRRLSGRPALEDAGWRAIVPWLVVGVLMSLRANFLWFGRPVGNPAAIWLAGILPSIEALRDHGRLRVATLMALVLGCGLAFSEFVRSARRTLSRFPRAGLAVQLSVVGAVAVASWTTHGRPPHAFGVPDLELARRLATNTGPVVEVPSHNEVHTWAMMRAIVHRRPIVNGYNGYYPASFPERMALADRLPDPAALDRLRAETGITSVVVHRRGLPGEFVSEATVEAWRAAARDPRRGIHLVAETPDYLLVDLDDPVPQSR